MYVNLGIGIPTLASNYLPAGVKVELQTENGMLGLGPYPSDAAHADPDIVNASTHTPHLVDKICIICTSHGGCGRTGR